MNIKLFISGIFAGFLGAFFVFMVICAIDAELCRQERENTQPQQCLFEFNCRNI